jgi:hypothetical protein
LREQRLASFHRLGTQSEVTDEGMIDAWVDARLRESEAGAFFGASNYKAYVARRT